MDFFNPGNGDQESFLCATSALIATLLDKSLREIFEILRHWELAIVESLNTRFRGSGP